jgi:hypothetical protein
LEKCAFIQKSLKSGISREKLASMLGYKNWRSLDIYMRRQGMKWDSKDNTYYYPAGWENTKANIIISLFRDKNADAKEIAKRMGFKDHRELASYMYQKGFIWSDDDKNYIQKPLNENMQSESLFDECESEPDDACSFSSSNSGLNKYMPLFEILLKHKERLLNLLLPSPSPGSIPRYTIPGITRTKSFYMSETISGLIAFHQRILNQFHLVMPFLLLHINLLQYT